MSKLLFPAIVSIIFIIISLFTAKMYSVGFRLSVVSTRLIFFFFFIIPLLFVGSLIFTRSNSFSIPPLLYREIQILTGIGFYVFLGAVVLGLMLLIGKIAHAQVSVFVASFILLASLGLAAAGLMQSRQTKVVDYTVTLPDAPASWEGKTAILISDTHFGLVNYKKFSDKIVDQIIALQPDLVLHAGDFYDGPKVNTAPLTESWKRLTNTVPVYMAPGNHEEYGDYAGFLTSLRDASITVLDDKAVSVDGVQIVGITYRSGKEPSGVKQVLIDLNLNDTAPAILINHPPTSLPAAYETGIDLVVAGHTHNGQFWPLTYLVRSIYGIYYYGLNTYEKMNVLTTSGVGTFGPPFRLFNTPELVRITFKTGK